MASPIVSMVMVLMTIGIATGLIPSPLSNPIVPAAGVLLLYILISVRMAPWASLVFLSVIFMFTGANIDAYQGLFYAVLLLAGFVSLQAAKGVRGKFSGVTPHNLERTEQGLVGGRRYTGQNATILSILAGFMIFLLFTMIQTSQNFVVIGAPSLATLDSNQVDSLGPAILGILGVIENTFFIAVFFFYLAIFGYEYVAVVLSGLTFAGFHAAAYGLNPAAMLFAFLWWVLNITAFLFFDRYTMDIAHYSNNVFIGFAYLGVSILGFKVI